MVKYIFNPSSKSKVKVEFSSYKSRSIKKFLPSSLRLFFKSLHMFQRLFCCMLFSFLDSINLNLLYSLEHCSNVCYGPEFSSGYEKNPKAVIRHEIKKWLYFILAFYMLGCKTFSASVSREIILANYWVEVKSKIHPGGTRTLEGPLISFLIYSENRFFISRE